MPLITDSKSALAISKLADPAAPTLVTVSGIATAQRLASDLHFFSSCTALVLPEAEDPDFSFAAKSRTGENILLSALASCLAKAPYPIIIAPKSASEALYPSPRDFLAASLFLDLSSSVSREQLIGFLAASGYERSGICESFGQFSVRGDIIDIFGPLMQDPVRIELFDEEIDSLRSFDSATQRAKENLRSVSVYPARLSIFKASSQINDYLPEGSLVITDDEDPRLAPVRSTPVYSGHMDIFARDLHIFKNKKYKISIVLDNDARRDNLLDFFERENLSGIEISRGSILAGVEDINEKHLYFSETDIFSFARRRKNTRHPSGSRIESFTDIRPGDYIVHDFHGIGIFSGVVNLTADGASRDYLKLQYAGNDILYIPVDQMGSIQKYMGKDSYAPRISRLSGNDWASTRQKVKESIREVAEQLLKDNARRAASPGFAFAPDSSWQKEFEDEFPYVETDDQLRCVEEIKQDMQSPKAMDRLLCGDVGFGKTEVACRAIFKCLEQGRQCAVLVPTTVLASQHYLSFTERFKNYPFTIEMLSRFRTDSECRAIIDSLASGSVDLVVGTHRLLSKDVRFKDLGLLVIDEEQRFGVEHKEMIKKLRENVDVLTLSATPIPRTLHMSLIGVRDMSVINEPPQDRYPVQTYVLEDDEKLMQHAINRELARKGQVFVVYNRVQGIENVAAKIRELVPGAVVSVGHGQMDERQLEDVMIGFSSGKSDILVSTTIIESGIDIPNVNTLIVLNADRFGLSQLYQLRGRVGRSNRMAYAYLFYHRSRQLSETAEKRLKAIRDFTEFGSGFRVAMRDLELRGAGNLLGFEQSGHMLQIGYELYCRLIDEAVAELTGKALPSASMQRECSVELGLSACIAQSYIADEQTRLDIYKRISGIGSRELFDDIYDELLDRFGELPCETVNLLNIAYIKNLASGLGISRIYRSAKKLVFNFETFDFVDKQKLSASLSHYGPALTLYAVERPYMTLVYASGAAGSCLAFLESLI